eukprot:CAMPEP_0116044672 /NCGR_PEP_ID=MMETSP0321-20121206/27152_1 /TAXON_ID=163516 /ORGANISM="Leptocylindrus danicus var. danicus, Strain B650" /LENGTH=720 /DNA_ID=CAMNT_0003525839 /DNA_START=156 /DNA_END=2323 /DNA_ORIENTATION=-
MTPQPLNASSDLIDKFGKFSIIDINEVQPGPDDDGSTNLPEGCTLIPWLANSDEKENTKVACGQSSGLMSIDQKAGAINQSDTRKSRLSRPSTASKRKMIRKSNIQSKGEIEITVMLDESETQTLFTMSGSVVPNDTPEYIAVRDRNIALEKPKGMVKLNDNSVQINFSFLAEEKGVLARPVSTFSVGVSCLDQSEVQDEKEDTLSEFVEKLVERAVSSKGCLLDCAEGTCSAYRDNEANAGFVLKIMFFASLNKIKAIDMGPQLAWIERAVTMNNNFDQQLRYYGICPLNHVESLKSSKMCVRKGLTKLYSYTCNLSDGRPITCMCWHKANDDILVVSYGSVDTNGSVAGEGGMVLFWSPRNLLYPEKIIRTKSIVTSMAFSNHRPACLAVGMHNGVICLFDTSLHGDDLGNPLLDSEMLPERHMSQVRDLKWVDKGDKGEQLISVALDGRILEWSTKKGFEANQLMKLRPVTEHNKCVLKQHLGGTCFEFGEDETSYLVGTDNGNIHRCSYSYGEQYIHTYSGHKRPVNSIKYSPFLPDIFLSCSIDWNMKLWKSDRSEPVLTFKALDLTDSVNDIAWSPHDSTVFASVCGDGRIELWDLSVSTLDPQFTLATSTTEGTKKASALTSVVYAKNAPIMVVGGESGNVDVYLTPHAFPKSDESPAEACVKPNVVLSERERLRLSLIKPENLMNGNGHKEMEEKKNLFTKSINYRCTSAVL